MLRKNHVGAPRANTSLRDPEGPRRGGENRGPLGYGRWGGVGDGKPSGGGGDPAGALLAAWGRGGGKPPSARVPQGGWGGGIRRTTRCPTVGGALPHSLQISGVSVRGGPIPIRPDLHRGTPMSKGGDRTLEHLRASGGGGGPDPATQRRPTGSPTGGGAGGGGCGGGGTGWFGSWLQNPR